MDLQVVVAVGSEYRHNGRNQPSHLRTRESPANRRLTYNTGRFSTPLLFSMADSKQVCTRAPLLPRFAIGLKSLYPANLEEPIGTAGDFPIVMKLLILYS